MIHFNQISKLEMHTVWAIRDVPVRNLNISTRCRPNDLIFLPVIEAYLKVFLIREPEMGNSTLFF